MSRATAQVTAASTDRSLVAKAPLRRRVRTDCQLLFWRRLIDSAVADACRTMYGVPTDSALLARWWIEEHRPSQSDKREWERSFECCCHWLRVDADQERVRLLAQIDAALQAACLLWICGVVRWRRAAVLSCAGVVVTIAGQRELPLVSVADYDHVAGVEQGSANTPRPRWASPQPICCAGQGTGLSAAHIDGSSLDLSPRG